MPRYGLRMVVSVLCALAVVGRADTVTTNDGRKLIGEIVKQDSKGVNIKLKMGEIHIDAKDLASVTKEPLPDGFFDIPKSATQSASKPVPLAPELQTMVDRLRKEVEGLRNELAEPEKKLRTTPPTVKKVYRLDDVGPGPHPPYGGGTKFQPLDVVTVNEPNPAYEALKKRIQTLRDSISVKNKQIVDIINNRGRESATEAVKRSDAHAAEDREGRGKIIAELQKRFGDPTATADQAVAVLLESKVVLEASVVQSKDPLDPRKALLFKSLLLGLSTAAEDRDSVASAKPDMSFCSVNYNFKFVTEAGLERHNQGYVHLCKIDGVWWPVQVNVDGVSAYWEAYEHPLVTPSLMQSVVKAYHEGQLNIGRLKQSDAAKIAASGPTPALTPQPAANNNAKGSRSNPGVSGK